MKKDFAVIGLGSFGSQLCKELAERGANVLAIDSSEERVNKAAEYITHAYCCDCTKEENLKKLGFGEIDHVIVAIGRNLEASILTTVLLKELGVKQITARAEDDSSKKILLRLGADTVINTQELAVQNLCGILVSDRVKMYLPVMQDYSIATLNYSERTPSVALKEMNLRIKGRLNVLLIQRGERVFSPTGEDHFEPGDSVVVFGTDDAISVAERYIK